MTDGDATDTLDAERIADGVRPALRSRLRRVTVLDEVDSTNTWLGRLLPAEQHAHAVLAERQTAGRGRGARRWHSPAGGNIYLSLGWRFPELGPEHAALPLAVAVAVSEALAAAGLSGAGIKWPNDILVEGRKLAGILVESQGRAGSGVAVIAGIGLNVRMARDGAAEADRVIDRPWTDLESLLPTASRPVDRNRLVSALLDHLLAAFDRFGRTGFASFRSRYAALDLIVGRAVSLEHDTREIHGVGGGVDDSGRLLITLPDGATRAFHVGEARLHSAPA